MYFVVRMCAIHIFVFFFNDTATTEIYTLSLHDALPILGDQVHHPDLRGDQAGVQHLHANQQRHNDGKLGVTGGIRQDVVDRSEEHTSELQSRQYLVCRLLLEKKKKVIKYVHNSQHTTCT